MALAGTEHSLMDAYRIERLQTLHADARGERSEAVASAFSIQQRQVEFSIRHHQYRTVTQVFGDFVQGGVECLRSMLHTGLRAMWSAIESTPGLQTLTYEITAYSLRHRTDGSPASGDIAVEQYRLMDEQARLFLDTCAERCDVEWSLPTGTLARLSLSVLDGVVLRWLVDRDGEAATAELGVVADIIATRAVERS